MSVAEIPAKLPSMNEANPRDPYNNNSYGTLVDSPYKLCSLPILDVEDFNERVIRGYEEGYGEKDLPADLPIARSLIAAGSATLRDFSYVAPEIPEYIPENCTGCMDCVTECPDTAILGKVLAESTLNERLLTITDPEERTSSSINGRRHASTTKARRRRAKRVAALRSSSTPASAKAARSASPSAMTTR